MYLTTTGTIVAQLTRMGRQLLADNSANFRISQYAFSDDEIDYRVFDGSTVDAANTDILGTPILEVNTVGGVPSQRYSIQSGPSNTIQVSFIDVDTPDAPFVNGKQYLRAPRNVAVVAVNTDVYNATSPYSLKVRTFYGFDTYYLLSASNLLEAGFVIPINIKAGAFNTGFRTLMTLIETKPSGRPCDDPYESDQRQSDSTITFHPVITPDSQVLNSSQRETLDFVLNRVDLSAALNVKASTAEIVDAWKNYIGQRIVSGFAQGQGNSFVDQYGETGMALGSLTVRGSDTGQLFTIETLLYSKSILTKILSSALGK